jgi:phosphate:Na+ symporter
MQTILLILTGLVLFLYALNRLSEGLKEVSGDSLKTFLDRFTSNVFKGILSGIIVTILLDSSSVVIIMTIALVNAKSLSFRQAMGIVMGANIGTTVSSQIFALNIGEYAAVPIAIGFFLMFFMKKSFHVNLGKVLFSFGLIFFGLFTIEEAVAPLRNDPQFLTWLQSLETTWKGMLAGAVVTVLVQSSSATLGMVIGLASQGLISLAASIAVMLGAELGTCADTLVASIGRTRAAVKTGMFHLLFNITTITVGMLSLPWFTQLVLILSKNVSLEQKVATAHMLFNTLGVLLVIPFLGAMERLLNRSFPEHELRNQPLEGA